MSVDIDLSELVAPLLEKWNVIAPRIEEIDARLNAKSFGRKKVLDALVDRLGEDVTKPVAQMKAFLENRETAQEKVAIFHLLSQLLNDSDLKALVDKEVEGKTEKVEALKPEHETAMKEERKGLVETAILVRQLILRTDPSMESKLPEFKQLRGGAPTGQRGTRLKSGFRFTIDGKDAGKTLTDVAKEFGVNVKAYSGDSNLRDAIVAQIPDFNMAEPPDEFEFTFQNKTIKAVKSADSTSNDSADLLEEEDDEAVPDVQSSDEMPPDPFD